MHIPDNYLSPATDAVLTVAMVPVWKRCIDAVREKLDREHMSFLGVSAAFSFLLMMFNVPLPGGTTGHAVGGTLIALFLGPEAACIAVSVALALQALIFGDGGILAFGANCFNMAFVLPFSGYAIYKLVAGDESSAARNRVAMAIGSWGGLNIAALLAAVEFGIQPMLFHDAAGQALYCPYPLSVSIPAMCIPHMLVAGVVEAVATIAIYEFVARTSPAYIIASGAQSKDASSKPVAVGALVGVLALLTPLGLLAEGDAWGEWGAEDVVELVGYAPQGLVNGFEWSAIMPDYTLAGLPDAAAYILSAVIGIAALVVIFRLASSTAQRSAS